MLFALVLLGCQSERSHKNNHNPVAVQPVKKFKNEHHLFLNYYFGMSIADYENATKQNFISRQVFLPGETKSCDLSRYTDQHAQQVEHINYHTEVYYEFTFDKHEFEATLKPVFKNDKLIRLEMQTLNCFNFGNHNHEFYRKRVNETRQALVGFHKKELGSYVMVPKVHNADELSVIQNAGVNIGLFDTHKYTFKNRNKVVTIEQKCCDFKPLVIYSHAEYLEIEKAPNSPEKLEREMNLFNSAEAI